MGVIAVNETLGIIGVPVMTKASFINIERGIGDKGRRKLQESMAEAGKKEKTRKKVEWCSWLHPFVYQKW